MGHQGISYDLNCAEGNFIFGCSRLEREGDDPSSLTYHLFTSRNSFAVTKECTSGHTDISDQKVSHFYTLCIFMADFPG